MNGDTTYPDKDFATARARAAMLGVELHRQDDDHGNEVFIATRGPLTKCFDTLAALLVWIAHAEGARH